MATSTPSPEPKAQHYIPRFYLKGFTDREGTLWVCEKFRPIRASKPKDEAHRPDYYTHAEKGERDETVESTLEEIESMAAPVVRKLANPQFEPSPEQMGDVYLFIAFMFARIPSWRAHLDKLAVQMAREEGLRNAKDKDSFHKFCAEFEKTSGEPLGMDYEELRQYFLKGDYEIVQGSVRFNLGAMIDSALRVARELENYGYERLYAPKDEFFLTSDSPVFTLQPDDAGQATIGMGFRRQGVEVYFPLNKRTCLRLKRGGEPAAAEMHHRGVTQINRVTMANAARYLYSAAGYRRISRLFDQHGCKIKPGENAFMLKPQAG